MIENLFLHNSFHSQWKKKLIKTNYVFQIFQESWYQACYIDSYKWENSFPVLAKYRFYHRWAHQEVFFLYILFLNFNILQDTYVFTLNVVNFWIKYIFNTFTSITSNIA